MNGAMDKPVVESHHRSPSIGEAGGVSLVTACRATFRVSGF